METFEEVWNGIYFQTIYLLSYSWQGLSCVLAIGKYGVDLASGDQFLSQNFIANRVFF